MQQPLQETLQPQTFDTLMSTLSAISPAVDCRFYHTPENKEALETASAIYNYPKDLIELAYKINRNMENYKIEIITTDCGCSKSYQFPHIRPISLIFLTQQKVTNFDFAMDDYDNLTTYLEGLKFVELFFVDNNLHYKALFLEYLCHSMQTIKTALQNIANGSLTEIPDGITTDDTTHVEEIANLTKTLELALRIISSMVSYIYTPNHASSILYHTYRNDNVIFLKPIK